MARWNEVPPKSDSVPKLKWILWWCVAFCCAVDAARINIKPAGCRKWCAKAKYKNHRQWILRETLAKPRFLFWEKNACEKYKLIYITKLHYYGKREKNTQHFTPINRTTAIQMFRTKLELEKFSQLDTFFSTIENV